MEENQGIMGLAPQVTGNAPPPAMGAPTQRTPLEDPEVAQAYEQIRSSVGPKEFTDEVFAATQQANPQLIEQFKQALSQQQLPAELLAALKDMLQLIFENPAEYAEIRQALLAEGVPEDLLPETFDVEFFVALNMALEQVQGTVPQQPMGFAEGGVVSLHPLARELQKFGREGDTILAHINPVEARMLKQMGGAGSTNPYTGLPEFFVKRVAKSLGKAVKSTAKAVGKVISSTAKAVTGVVKSVVKEVKRFAKSDLGRIVITVAAGYFLGPAAANMLGVTSTAGVAAVSGFVGGFSSGMAAGDGVKNSLKNGATGAVLAGTFAVATGGTSALQAGSYTGPTTISGQYDKLMDNLGLGTPVKPETPTLQTAGTPTTATDIAAGDYMSTADYQNLAGPGGTPAPSQFAPTVNPDGSMTASLGRAATDPVTGLPPQVNYNVGPPGAPGFSYDPITGEMLAPPTPIGPGMSATSFPPASGDYLSTLDAQNLARTGGGVGPLPKPVVAPMDPSAYSLTSGAPMDGAFRANAGLGGQPVSYTPNYFTGEAAAGGTGVAPGVTGATPATAVGTSAQPGFFEQIGQGDLTGAAKTGYQNVVDFYSPQPDPAAVQQAYTKELASRAQMGFDVSNAAVKESAYQAAVKSAAPMLGTTSRLALTGLGGAYASGAFAPPAEPEVPEGFDGPTGTELLAQDPGRYGVTPGGASAEYFASYPGMTPTQIGYGPTNIYYNQSGYTPSQGQGQGVFSLRPPPLQQMDFRSYSPMGIAGLAPRRYNMGGFVPGYKKGGAPNQMSDYPRRTGAINGPGTKTSDSIPAMLSDGEFVFTADAVRGAGNGSRRDGARKMYAMMKALERKA